MPVLRSGLLYPTEPPVSRPQMVQQKPIDPKNSKDPGSRLMVQNWLNNTETNKKKGITEASGKPPELSNYWVTGFCEKYSCTVAEVLLCGRCFQAKFCSKKCQKEHWPEHQEDCRLNPDPIPAFLHVQLGWMG